LWGSQVEQINISPKGDIELVPRVGNHVIILGNLDNYEYKLKKLETLYLKGFDIVDWNKYSSINLKYSDQVICKKR
ncbi:MAG: cell division protein FtsQ, partial [Bacteroidales bacterium]